MRPSDRHGPANPMHGAVSRHRICALWQLLDSGGFSAARALKRNATELERLMRWTATERRIRACDDNRSWRVCYPKLRRYELLRQLNAPWKVS